MKIFKITLENWGPYHGVHEFDIDVTNDAPLIVIWGGNGKGKTKFIDALKWVFSGGDFGYIKVGPYINLTALEEGQIFQTSVTVEFEQNGNNFRVRRELEVDPAFYDDPVTETAALNARLMKMADKTQVKLEKIGYAAYTPQQARAVLLRLFPARLVNFYFFDAAELIESFNEMSGSKGVYFSTKEIQNSVETAMGFKGYEGFLGSLRELREDLSKKADADVKDRHKLGEYRQERAGLEAQEKVILEDISASNESLTLKRTQLEESKQILEGMGEHLDQQRDRQGFQAEINLSKQRMSTLRQDLAELFPMIVMAPIKGLIMHEQKQISELQAENQLWNQKKVTQETVIANLEAGLADSDCPHCGRPMEQSHRETALARLEAEKQLLNQILSSAPARAGNLDSRKISVFDESLWAQSSQVTFDSFLSKAREIESLKVSIADKEQKISSIDVQLGAVGTIDFLATHEQILGLEKEIDALEQHISSSNEFLAQLRSKIQKVDSQISTLAFDSGSKAQVRLRKVEKLISELTFILQELKLEVRLKIQEESNTILQFLASDSDKQFQISISEDYTLSTDKFNPNAGFKQQLVLAFLFAIPRVAGAPFPVVIDSPLQHMDANNRANFLSWCTTGLSQLVLLPHDAEMTKEEVPTVFGSSLSRFYELLHDSQTKVSSVRRLG